MIFDLLRVAPACRRLAPAIALLTAITVSGCAASGGTLLTFPRREALDSFVGKDRSTVIAELGPPNRTYELDGRELLAYDHHELKWMPGEPGAKNAAGYPEGPWVDDSNCSTEFRLSGGLVDAWRLSGNDCRNLPFPPVGRNINHILEQVKEHGVNQVATFPHDPFTAESFVGYGAFYHD